MEPIRIVNISSGWSHSLRTRPVLGKLQKAKRLVFK